MAKPLRRGNPSKIQALLWGSRNWRPPNTFFGWCLVNEGNFIWLQLVYVYEASFLTNQLLSSHMTNMLWTASRYVAQQKFFGVSPPKNKIEAIAVQNIGSQFILVPQWTPAFHPRFAATAWNQSVRKTGGQAFGERAHMEMKKRVSQNWVDLKILQRPIKT